MVGRFIKVGECFRFYRCDTPYQLVHIDSFIVKYVALYSKKIYTKRLSLFNSKRVERLF